MVTPAERYFEDYQIGMVDEFGEVLVTAEEIVEFARGTIHRRCTLMRLRQRQVGLGG
jgi:acyl dehydratase